MTRIQRRHATVGRIKAVGFGLRTVPGLPDEVLSDKEINAGIVDCDYPTRTDGDHIDRELESFRMAVFDVLDELPTSTWGTEFWDVVREVATLEQLRAVVLTRTEAGIGAHDRLRAAAGVSSEEQKEDGDGNGRRV